mgnify:CR=1 FL=1
MLTSQRLTVCRPPQLHRTTLENVPRAHSAWRSSSITEDNSKSLDEVAQKERLNPRPVQVTSHAEECNCSHRHHRQSIHVSMSQLVEYFHDNSFMWRMLVLHSGCVGGNHNTSRVGRTPKEWNPGFDIGAPVLSAARESAWRYDM